MRADRCPGVLRAHQAADGALVRLRVPGGQTTGEALQLLSEAAVRYGSGVLQLTSRAGLQIRGLADPLPEGLVAAVAAAGFLPSATHERVRNVVASPLTGLHGGRADLRAMITELDRSVMAQPDLADLSGRFLFALDDGRGDTSALTFDLGYLARDATSGWVLVGDRRHGVNVAAGEAVALLVGLAVDFLRARHGSTTGTWHVRDLQTWAQQIPGREPLRPPEGSPEAPLGRVGAAASVAVPLAMLTPNQVAAVVRVAPGPVVVTPWRGLVVPGAAAQLPTLLAAGLVSDPESGWARVSACVGAPGCDRSLISTRELAGSLARLGPGGDRVHISGCERRCGAPSSRHVDLVAPPSVRAALELIGAGS